MYLVKTFKTYENIVPVYVFRVRRRDVRGGGGCRRRKEGRREGDGGGERERKRK